MGPIPQASLPSERASHAVGLRPHTFHTLTIPASRQYHALPDLLSDRTSPVPAHPAATRSPAQSPPAPARRGRPWRYRFAPIRPPAPRPLAECGFAHGRWHPPSAQSPRPVHRKHCLSSSTQESHHLIALFQMHITDAQLLCLSTTHLLKISTKPR